MGILLRVLMPHRRKLLFGGIFALLLFALLIAGRIGLFTPPPAQLSDPSLTSLIPTQTDWIDFGPILPAGAPGEWDHLLYGGFAATLIKKDAQYFLYYQGAEDYDETYETVSWRTIGLATSRDGIHYTKHPANPLLTWFPNEYLEEGAVSSSAVLHNGEIHLIYGANTEETEGKINADIRLATSEDGSAFTDQGVVLAHTDPDVWAHGDELFPVTAFADDDHVFIYYIPNGVLWRGMVGAAWGTRDNLESARVQRRGLPVYAWGTAGYAEIAPDIYAIFLNDVRRQRTTVYLTTPDAPWQFTGPIAKYQFADYAQSTILLDEATHTWFMVYRNQASTGYGIKLAPYGPADETPPTPPEEIAFVVDCSQKQVQLQWAAAEDAETGVAAYELYHNNALLVQTTQLTYPVNLTAAAGVWKIRAINFHQTTGSFSTPMQFSPEDACLQ